MRVIRLAVMVAVMLLIPVSGYCDLALSWEASPTPDVVQYNVYMSIVSAADLDAQKINSQYVFTVPASRRSTCVSSAQFAFTKVVYVAVTAAASGAESILSNKVYYLRGNIYDRNNTDTGAVNVRDMQELQTHFGKTVTHQYINCNSDFVIAEETNLQAADINRDGRVDFLDQAEVAIHFGNATR